MRSQPSSDKARKAKAEREEALKEACRLVEAYARTIGKECEIIFLDDGVQVAPLSWSGCATADDLFSALVEARESTEE